MNESDKTAGPSRHTARQQSGIASQSNNAALPKAGQRLGLRDGQNHLLGNIMVNAVRGNKVSGLFEPTPDFESVRPLFDDFLEAANTMQFSWADEVDSQIGALRLRVQSESGEDLPAIDDVQIGCGTIDFCFPPNGAAIIQRAD